MKKTIKAFNTGGLELPDDATFLHLSPFQPGGLFGGAIRSSETTRIIKEIYPNSYVVHCWNIPLESKPMPSFLAGNNDVLSDVKMLYIDFKIELCLEAIPDAVIFDHPWLWNEAKKIKKMFPHCKIVHASQNIEWKLKEDLLAKLDKDVSDKVISLVKDLEIEIANEADLITCCTDNDKQWFLDNGAKNVIVANNGTSIKISQVESGKKYALTVGSGHPPNIVGSLKYLNNATEWLPENTDLMFVGGMCDGLRGALGKERDEDKNSTVRFLGSRDNDELAKLIQSASVIVLPIPYGGGSNLKTSEALVSGRPIVGTTVSFRGFQEFMNAENVIVTDDIEEFHDAVNLFCNKKLPTVKRTNIESLSWDSTFKEFIKYITSNN